MRAIPNKEPYVNLSRFMPLEAHYIIPNALGPNTERHGKEYTGREGPCQSYY